LYPALAVTAHGQVVVAWQDNRFDPDPLWTGHTPVPGGSPSGTDPDNWQILASVRAPGGTEWPAPARVSASATSADRHPSIAPDSAGGFVLIWESKALQSSGANLSLRASRSTDGGGTWSAWQPVGAQPAAMSQRPRLARDTDQAVRAVWYDTRSADWRWKVFTARLDPDAGWSDPTQISIGGNGTWPAVDRGVVVFTSDRKAARTQRDRTQQVYLTRV
jgi:hypothetical protein